MDMNTLIAKLDELSTITNEEWLHSLCERKKKELEFHDKNKDKSLRQEAISHDTYEQFYGNQKYYSTVQRSTDYTHNWIKTQAKDKLFLDYCCGNGQNAILAAKHGAKLAVGIDISGTSLNNARQAAKEAGVEKNTYFLQGDAENTKLPADLFDTVICSGVLHHLDLSYALPELRRILAPKGRILAIEALDYNPAIKLYRYLTPQMRTEWEKAHILSLKDVKFAKRFFETGDVKYWHMTSYLGAHFKTLLPLFNTLDDALTNIPLLQRLAWIFTFELIKPSK